MSTNRRFEIGYWAVATVIAAMSTVACGGAETGSANGESTSAATAGECITKAKAAGPVGSQAWRDALKACLTSAAGTSSGGHGGGGGGGGGGGNSGSCSYATQTTDGERTCSGGPNDGATCTDEADCRARCSYDGNGTTGCAK